jgi:hypothetical protein
MVRRYADTVEVRPAAGAAAEDGTPSTFLWRGRLYVVREVLGHWRERRAWWTGAAARAVHGEGGEQQVAAWAGGRAAGAPDLSGPNLPAPGLPALDRRDVALGLEREVWRVEASPGRSFGSGVYDLCRDLSSTGAHDGAWRLLRVAD